MAKKKSLRINRRPSAGLAERLRAAVIDSGLSYYRVGIDAELGESTVGRIMKGENEPTLIVAEAIAAAIGKRIVIVDAPKEK